MEPDPPPATRIVRVGGNLDFGAVPFFTVRDDGVLAVSNDGNDVLRVDNIGYETDAPIFRSACGQLLRPSLIPPTFAVPPGETLPVGISFAPRPLSIGTIPPGNVIDCTGTFTVNGNQTSGTNTIAVTAIAVP